MRSDNDAVYTMPVDGDDDPQQPLRSKIYRVFDVDNRNAFCRQSLMGPGKLAISSAIFVLVGCFSQIILEVVCTGYTPAHTTVAP